MASNESLKQGEHVPSPSDGVKKNSETDYEALACDIRQKKEYLRKLCSPARTHKQASASDRDRSAD